MPRSRRPSAKDLEEPERLVQAAVGRRAAGRARRGPGRFRRSRASTRRLLGREVEPVRERATAIAVRKAGPVPARAKSSASGARWFSSTWEARARAFCRSPILKKVKSPRRGRASRSSSNGSTPRKAFRFFACKGAAIEADWTNLKKGVTVEARVTKTCKGGLEVDVDGIRGFLPISQIDLSRVDDAASYVNQKFKAIVTEANQREKNLVISRRELLEQERAEQREKTWATLEEGQIRDGIIRSIKDFGAFVDIGGVDGLLPIGEMSWSRVSKVDEMVKTGDQVKVKVLKIDRVARKLTLGLKQLTPSPWQAATEKYPRGTMVKGKVSKIMDFGAFVELEPGIEGLIHISELSPTRVRRVVDIVKPEQEVEVRILKVEPEVKRIALSLLPDKKAVPTVDEDEEETDDDEAPPPPRPEPKIPLKGGLGDREPRKNRLN